MSRTTPLILPHGSGNLPLFSLTVQGICQNISMWRTEHGKNTPISNKVMAHSSSHTNQIHSNSSARANTHHNALSGVHMAQPPHFNDVELCSKATFYHLKKLLCIYICQFGICFTLHNRMVSTLHQFLSFPCLLPHTQSQQLFNIFVFLSICQFISRAIPVPEERKK